MALICFASVRSCGVTTMAAGLAMLRAGGRPALLVEADPAGGTLAAAAGLAAEPGLVSLAAAARRQGEPALVFDHAQTLPGNAPVVCGPPSASRARSALSMLSGLLGRLGELDAEVLCDCGRLDPTTTNVEMVERADLAVLVCRPRLSDLNALGAFFDERPEASDQSALVLVGDGPYPAKEITDVLGLDVAGRLPWDPDAASAVATAPLSSLRLSRTPLVRALRSLGDEFARRIEATRLDRNRGALSSVPASGAEGLVAEVRS